MKFLLATLVALSLAAPAIGIDSFLWPNAVTASEMSYEIRPFGDDTGAMPSQLCQDGMIAIWQSAAMFYYRYYSHPLSLVDYDTGMFNCDINALAGLKCLCNESLGGRIITADFESDGCDYPDPPFGDSISVPLCVSNYCTDSEAILITNAIFSCPSYAVGWSRVSASFKVPKSCKATKSPKSPKTTKTTKAPK